MLEVEHVTESATFLVTTDHGQSTLRYRLTESGVDFYTTYVHPADRGSRVGLSLLQAAVVWAQTQQLPMQASCWYVDKYLRKHGLI